MSYFTRLASEVTTQKIEDGRVQSQGLTSKAERGKASTQELSQEGHLVQGMEPSNVREPALRRQEGPAEAGAIARQPESVSFPTKQHVKAQQNASQLVSSFRAGRFSWQVKLSHMLTTAICCLFPANGCGFNQATGVL